MKARPLYYPNLSHVPSWRHRVTCMPYHHNLKPLQVRSEFFRPSSFEIKNISFNRVDNNGQDCLFSRTLVQWRSFLSTFDRLVSSQKHSSASSACVSLSLGFY